MPAWTTLSCDFDSDSIFWKQRIKTHRGQRDENLCDRFQTLGLDGVVALRKVLKTIASQTKSERGCRIKKKMRQPLFDIEISHNTKTGLQRARFLL